MYHVAVVLIPDYSLLEAVTTIEVLRICNSLFPEPAFSWEFVHINQCKVKASNGMVLDAPLHLGDARRFDALIVCASFNHYSYDTPAVLAQLRTAARRARLIGSIDTGVYFLARAGLLDNKRATAHFNSIAMFATQFPKVHFVKQSYTYSEGRMTCAGAMTCIDMMLALIRDVMGHEAATRTAGMMLHLNWRDQEVHLDNLFTAENNGLTPTVRRACRVMEDYINEPQTADAIANRVGVSRRTLDRRFMQTFNCSTSSFFRMLRLGRARKLIKTTNLEITSISMLCGFQSYSHFRRIYRDAYGVLPSRDRVTIDDPRDDTKCISPLHDLHPYQRV